MNLAKEYVMLHESFGPERFLWSRSRYMKTKLPMLIGFLIVLAFIIPGVSATGNDAMSGKHYNLNLISIKNIDRLPTDDTGNNGNRIFVNFDGRSKILLSQNWVGTFNVIDYIATRNDPAEFTLPAPENIYDAAGNYVSAGAYKVFVRVVGSPGGSGQLSTCAVDEFGTEICSVYYTPGKVLEILRCNPAIDNRPVQTLMMTRYSNVSIYSIRCSKVICGRTIITA